MSVQELKDYLETLPSNFKVLVNGKEVNGLNILFEASSVSLSLEGEEALYDEV